MTPPLLSILIVNYNGIDHLAECLGSLYAEDFRDFEVILVDNASRDGSAGFIRRSHPQVTVVESDRNLGFAGGNNLGLPRCRGRYVFFLNNDTALEPGALGALAEAIRSHPRQQVFGAFLINYRQRDLADSAGDCVYASGAVFSFTGYPAAMFREPRFICSPCAAAAIYSRDLLGKIGGFDEDFFLNFEDLDLGYRAQHAGEKVLFLPEVKVFHKGSATLKGKSSYLSIYYAERNFPLFVLKNFPLPNLIRFLPRLAFIKTLRLLTLLPRGGGRAWLKGTFDGLRLLPRMLPKRKAILAASRLTPAQFDSLLRKHWVRERLMAKRGRFDIPLGP